MKTALDSVHFISALDLTMGYQQVHLTMERNEVTSGK